MKPGNTTPTDAQRPPTGAALATLAEEAIVDAQYLTGDERIDMMIFEPHAFTSFPKDVIMDGTLEPVDKLIWLVLVCHARLGSTRAFVPAQDVLADQANVRSLSTIHRALTILRATRWLTLCAGPRHEARHATCNVYALRNHPLSLAEVLALDRGYAQFIEQLQGSRHAPAQRLAKRLMSSLPEDHPANRRDSDMPLPARPTAYTGPKDPQGLAIAPRSASNPRQQVHDVNESPLTGNAKRPNEDPHTQILRRGQPQYQNSSSSHAQFQNLCAQNSRTRNLANSSSNTNKYKITTTTCMANFDIDAAPVTNFDNDPGDGERHPPATASTAILSELDDADLIFPKSLTPAQRRRAFTYLLPLPVEDHQPLLDELEGRLRSVAKGANEVYNALRFLYHLSKAARSGTFEPNLGLAVVEERARAERVRRSLLSIEREAPLSSPHPPRSSVTRDTSVSEIAESVLDQLRQTVELPPREDP